MEIYDKNYNLKIIKGSIIKTDSMVNGYDEFIIYSSEPLDIRYNYDINRKYEYNMLELLNNEFIIIGNINKLNVYHITGEYGQNALVIHYSKQEALKMLVDDNNSVYYGLDPYMSVIDTSLITSKKEPEIIFY